MNITESLKTTGEITVRIKDEDGDYKDLWQENWLGRLTGLRIPYVTGFYTKSYHTKNLIVDDGLAGLASRFNGDGGEAVFEYIAVGSDDTSETSSDSALENEITGNGLERASASVSRETTNVTDDTAVLENSFSVTGSESVSEIGIFNDASSGTMYSRKVIATKNVEDGDTFEVTYKTYGS